MAKRLNKPPVIISITGLSLIFVSYLIDKSYSSGFLSNVNSDTFGVGLALLVGGLIWLIFKFKA